MASALPTHTPPAPHAASADRRRHLLRLLEGRPSVPLVRCIHALALRLGLLAEFEASKRLLVAACRYDHVGYALKVFDQIPRPSLYTWNVLIQACASSPGDGPALARRVLASLLHEGRYFPDGFTYTPAFKAASALGDGRLGRTLHGMVAKSPPPIRDDEYVLTTLVQAYVSCGDLGSARAAFTRMPQRNTVAWSIWIAALVDAGRCAEAVEVFHAMEGGEDEVRPNSVTMVALLGACKKMGDLELGKRFHQYIESHGIEKNFTLQNALMDMYIKCGSPHDALEVFKKIPDRNAVTWSSLIHALVTAGLCAEAVEAFRAMEDDEGARPGKTTMMRLVKACGKMRDLDLGKKFHRYLESRGIEQDVILCNALLDMYIKCGSVQDALEVFDKMPERDNVSWTTMVMGLAKSGDFNTAEQLLVRIPTQGIGPWNALISAYEQSGWPKKALETFRECLTHVEPDRMTLVSALSACAHLCSLDMGLWIHAYMKKHGIELDDYLTTSLIDMYAKCGALDKALHVFESADQRSVFVWSAVISALSLHGQGPAALDFFEMMLADNVAPDKVTFEKVLWACHQAGLVDEGRRYFNQMRSIFGIEPETAHYALMVNILDDAGFDEEAKELKVRMPAPPQ